MFLGSLHQVSLFSVDIYYAAAANAFVKLRKRNITGLVSLSLQFKFLQELSRMMQDTRIMAVSSFCCMSSSKALPLGFLLMGRETYLSIGSL